jgi:hypothetical protein
VWQGRFRSFPIQEDEHLLIVHRYIERNPVRAGFPFCFVWHKDGADLGAGGLAGGGERQSRRHGIDGSLLEADLESPGDQFV